MTKKSLFLLFIFFPIHIFSIADWTLYVHMQADNDLSAYASMDLVGEMAKATLSERVNVLVECDMPKHEGTYRIKIENNEARILDVLSYEMGQNQEHELVDGMKWVSSNYSAKHYAISLWGHGSGIIDPIRSLTRGILYDFTNNTYLNNQALVGALSKIKSEILSGKNIDVVGMDACLMADLEVGYQIKDSVDYFVASQQTEPAFGWDYSGFLTETSKSYCTPAQFATEIVNSYKTFYDNKKTSDYTQSAVDLNKINLMEQNLDQVISKWNECEDILGFNFKEIINQIRKQSLEFEDDDFIDLHFFYKNILDEINKIEIPEPVAQVEPEPEPQILPRPTASRPRPIFFRPNFRPRPNVFAIPIVAQRPNLVSRPSNVPRPSRPVLNVNPRPPRPVSNVRPAVSPRPQLLARPSNVRPSIQRPASQRPQRPQRPNYSRPLRPNNVVRPVIRYFSDFISDTDFRTINFEKLNLSNQELESLNSVMRELKNLLISGMNLIEDSVIANVTGPDMKDAKGVSIYFPKDKIHDSYYLTNFANNGDWVSFLEKFI